MAGSLSSVAALPCHQGQGQKAKARVGGGGGSLKTLVQQLEQWEGEVVPMGHMFDSPDLIHPQYSPIIEPAHSAKTHIAEESLADSV